MPLSPAGPAAFLQATVVIVLALLPAIEAADACYYPNGSEAKDAFPCGDGDAVQCCPFNWQCLSNGLCFNPAPDAGNIFGRYSCTDKNWDDPACPNFCTQNGRAIGNEAILACGADKNYCCDKNRQAGDCCVDEGFEFIDLPFGTVYASVVREGQVAVPTTGPGPSLPFSEGETPSPTVGTTRQSTPSPPSTPAPSSAASSAEPTSSSEELITSRFTSVASGTAGQSTVVVTNVVTTQVPVGNAGNAGDNGNGGNEDSGGTNVGLIVGCAVGVPVALALIGLASFLLLRRRRNAASQSPHADSTSPAGGAAAIWKPSGHGKPSTDSTYAEKYTRPSVLPAGSQGNPAEIDSAALAAAPASSSRPISELADTSIPGPHNAELEGSSASLAPQGAFTRAPRTDHLAGDPSRRSDVPSSASISPAVGATQFRTQSPVSSQSTPSSTQGEFHQDDMRAKGAQLAHFGSGGLAPVQEGQVANPPAPNTQTQGGRYIPYRPPQA